MPNSVRFNAEYPSIKESEGWYGRSHGLIPAYTQTLAKGPTQFVNGVAPKYLQRGKGARLGRGWQRIPGLQRGHRSHLPGLQLRRGRQRHQKQLDDGITFSLVHPLEVELAELIREVVPNAESVRYGKTGAEVTSAAVRLARAFTGRDKVLCCGYHGWHDWYIGVSSRDAGVPQATKALVNTFNYNDLASVEAALDETVACVILEPMTFDFPKDDFLAQAARQLASATARCSSSTRCGPASAGRWAGRRNILT